MEHDGRRVAAWQRLLLFVAVSLATRWLSLFVDVIDLDESAHIVGSWEMMRGRLLYEEFVNNKPPLLYVYYAAAQVLFGRSLFAVHLLTALVTVPLTAFAVSAYFRHRREGLIGGLLVLVYGASFIGHDMLASNTEMLMILPASWALVLLRAEQDALAPCRSGAAGLLIGLVFLLVPGRDVGTRPGACDCGGRSGATRRAAVRLVDRGARQRLLLPLLATWGWFASRGAGDALPTSVVKSSTPLQSLSLPSHIFAAPGYTVASLSLQSTLLPFGHDASAGFPYPSKSLSMHDTAQFGSARSVNPSQLLSILSVQVTLPKGPSCTGVPAVHVSTTTPD